jgi:hypothetical protein
MSFWKPITIDGILYDLTHLHPKTLTYQQPPKNNQPERTYTVDIFFGLHCFTKGVRPEIPVDQKLAYSDARETRIFDITRYELSKRLPDLVEKLGESKCYHTSHGNFFTIEIIINGEDRLQYEVYFALTRSSKRGKLNLWVQSAYVRDREHETRHRKKSIGFFVLLFNVQNCRPVKTPP